MIPTRVALTRSGNLRPMTYGEWLDCSGWGRTPLGWWPCVKRGDGYEILPDNRGRRPRARGRLVNLPLSDGDAA